MTNMKLYSDRVEIDSEDGIVYNLMEDIKCLKEYIELLENPTDEEIDEGVKSSREKVFFADMTYGPRAILRCQYKKTMQLIKEKYWIM